MSNLYYDEALTSDDLQPGRSLTLDGDEAHHAISVSRLRASERVLIGNGAGVLAESTVTEVTKKSFTVEVNIVDLKSPMVPEVMLVQALAKGDRDERAIEAATEAGVDAVHPYQATRSVSRWSHEKVQKGMSRWRKVVREASKQSLRHWIPEVRELLTPDTLVQLTSESVVLVLEPTAEVRLSSLNASELRGATQVVLVVGPEGGFDPAELLRLGEAGAQLVRLGDTVLRTSTAGVAALSVLNTSLGRW